MTKSTLFLLTILGVLVGYLGYELYTRKIPCVTPVTYALADLDSKFTELDVEQVNEMLDQAAAVWNEALGRDVFIHEQVNENPDLPVSFVYGQVQKTVDTLESIDGDIEAAKAEATKIGNEYAQKQREGASEEVLKPLRDRYYELRDRVNADVAKSRNAIPEGDIKEGRYISDETGQHIYIYGYQTKTELQRAITHEFGHALGLGHVANKDSIMYPDNMLSTTNLRLTAEDKAEMVRACPEK
ncbi:matrixin family metalloprotease [Candidatus Parcubacteria bacterium]|nr:matrixin family metalloprotease [Candidatus Parcubacteria bacterium]